MTAVIGVLAFVMAFGAIWFTSEAVRRVDTRNEAMLRPHFRKINAAIDENHEATRSLQARLAKLEKQVHTLKLNAELPSAVADESAAIQAGLDNLRHFTPTIRLNG